MCRKKPKISWTNCFLIKQKLFKAFDSFLLLRNLQTIQEELFNNSRSGFNEQTSYLLADYLPSKVQNKSEVEQ